MSINRERPIDLAINEMRLLYGLTNPLAQQAEELNATHNHDTESRGETLLVTQARETQRVFKKKSVQGSVRHPLLILATYIYNFISNQIQSIFINSAKIKEKNDTLFLANSLKNHGFITQKQFIIFKEEMSEGNSKNITKEIVRDLFLKNRIDRKNYIHLTTLAHNGHIKEVLQFLFALSSVSNINRFKENLKEIVSPKEQLEMIEMLKEAYDYSRFPEKSVQAFSTLTARVEIYSWLKEDTLNNKLKKDLLETLCDTNSHKFEIAMRAFLQGKVNTTRGLEKTYYLELIQSFNTSKAENSFIHFSQALESLSVLKDWEEKVSNLEEALTQMSRAESQINDEGAHKLLEDLKELYTIFGKILENEKEFGASHTAMGLEQGILRAKWRNIGNLINKISGHHEDSHHICGCMFDLEQQEAWPDVENTEIRPSNPLYKPERAAPPAEQKKINVLGFYCNWGSGHRSNMQGLSESLGSEEFHFSSVDLPQTALLPLDPINKIAGGDHTIATMFNTLLAGRYLSWINFLDSMSQGKPDEATATQYRTLIREQVLKQRPDIILVNFGSYLPFIIDVAKELGIPVLRVHTDMDVQADAFDLNGYDHDVPHFKKAIPYAIPEMTDYLKGQYNDDQIAVTGFSIRPQFYKMKEELKNPENLQALKAKYGIKEDEVTYMVTGGGCGSENPFPRLIAASKKGEIPKGHLFFVTGRNKDAINDYKEFLKENRDKLNGDITIHLLEDYTPATQMAELIALSASTANNGKRGLVLGKGGGSTLAEVLWMESQLLIDMRGDSHMPWELFAAKKLQEFDLANVFKNENDFIQQVNERCSKEAKDYSLFNGQHPEKRMYEVIKQMVHEAQHDPNYVNKQIAWKTNQVFMRGIKEKGEVLNYFDSLASINQVIRDIEHDRALEISPAMLQRLQEKKPISIHFKSMSFVTNKEYQKDESRLTVRYFINQLEKNLKEKKPSDQQLLCIASLYLDLVNHHHAQELKQGLDKCKSNPFMMEIAYLDRLLAASMITPDTFTFATDDQNPERSVLMMYKTALAKEQLKAWVSEQTSKGRNKGNPNETLLDKTSALRSFLLHPDQYNWIMSLRIHRLASTFNHKLEVNAQGEVMIRFNGEKKSASELIGANLTSIGKRVVDSTQGKEYVYHYENGFQEASAATHPDNWNNTIPLFKKKERKSNDYRLEIVTDTQTGEMEHAWIRLKHPNGEIYSVGRFWDPDVDLPAQDTTATLPGNLRACDQHEFLARKKGEHLTITKIDLGNKQNFNKIKRHIESLQKKGDSFNIFNKNCVSLVNEVCSLIEVPVESVATISEQILPFSLSTRKYFLMQPWIRDLSLISLYPATLVSHLVLGIFGAFKRHSLSGPNSKPLFYDVESFLNPRCSLIDSPIQLRAWQECAQEELGKKPLKLDDLRIFSKRISRAKILNQIDL